MIALNRRTKIFVCKEPTDMRASYDSLFAKVKSLLDKDPFSGHLFLFVNSRRNSCKCLYYDGTGLVIISKRLEKGLFSRINPMFRGEVVLTEAEFGLFFEGANLEKRFVESPVELKKQVVPKQELQSATMWLWWFYVEEDVLFKIIPTEKYDLLTREELIILAKGEQDLRMQMQKEVTRLRALHDELKQQTLAIGDQLIVIKNKLFGKSSERSAKSPADKDLSKTKVKKTKVQLPSLRYPDAPVIERRIELSVMPDCKSCGEKLVDSGMTEDSEYLTVIPEQFFVVKQLRHKYCCDSCHGDIQTAPCPPRIKDKSSYSDEMVIDVAMSKYCDLIPIERYSSIAGRAGLKGLPANSLIASTHNLADFLKPVYGMFREAIRLSKILHADETPHRMLEGDKTSYWQLWGFSNHNTSYFEAHGTRSGDVAIDLITESKCEFLVSDVFSGYGRAVKEANKIRKEKNLPLIKNIYCNAHARRKFKECEENFPDAKFFIDQYKEIYRLNKEAKDKPPDETLKTRSQMTEYFTAMRTRAWWRRSVNTLQKAPLP